VAAYKVQNWIDYNLTFFETIPIRFQKDLLFILPDEAHNYQNHYFLTLFTFFQDQAIVCTCWRIAQIFGEK